jgi:putative chitinase
MTLTQEKLTKILTRNKSVAPLFEALSKMLPKYEINTLNRVAGFLAQCGHESADFTVLKENLNYGAKGLRATFPKYFATDAAATQYERQPEKIANRIYANRMGNGAETTGDGYKYRGRGAIQLTGHDNYAAFAKSINKTIDETVAYCETMDGAIESACWFWKKNNLNATCDANDIVAMTKKINGGTIGLDERKSHYEKAKQVLA